MSTKTKASEPVTPPYVSSGRLLHRVTLAPRKLAHSLAGRRNAADRWLEWSAGARSEVPLVWMHGASVGEALAVRSIATRFRARPEPPGILHSYTSPSVAGWPDVLPAERSDYAPLDGHAGRVFATVKPSLLVFARADVWPGMVAAARQQDIPIAVVGGIVRAHSRRLRWPARPLLKRTYRSIDFVGAVTTADADRWRGLGVVPERIDVTGDPRDDTIIERTPSLDTPQTLIDWADGWHVLLAGSTHERDHGLVLDAFSSLRASDAPARLVIVPHDVAPDRVRRLSDEIARRGLRMVVWSGGPLDTPSDVLIVARTGILADLYLAATAAYVGGGFERAGAHSIAEAAAFAVPTAVGPRSTTSSESGRFVVAGAAVRLPERNARAALIQRWTEWLNDPDERIRRGLQARRLMSTGGADRSMLALAKLVSFLG